MKSRRTVHAWIEEPTGKDCAMSVACAQYMLKNGVNPDQILNFVYETRITVTEDRTIRPYLKEAGVEL